MRTVDQISGLGLVLEACSTLLLRSVNGACTGSEMTLDIPADNLDDADLSTLSSKSWCTDLVGMDSCVADCVATAAVTPWSGSQSFLGTAITYLPLIRSWPFSHPLRG